MAESWQWVYVEGGKRDGHRLDYRHKRTRKVAATVFLRRDYMGHNWFVWDRDGCGGENSREPTIKAAQEAAIEAAIRWGKHDLPPHTPSEASDG